jgi:hypothetical protein
MRVKTALVAFAAWALAGGGTAYADGAPIAGVQVGGGGVEWGALRYVALPAPGGTTVAQIDMASGTVNDFVALHGAWGIPQVAYDGSTGGLSVGGKTLVLGRNAQTLFPARSRFALVNPVKMRLRRVVTLPGAFFFDAISPDGDTMYLIQLTSPRNILRYAVRAFDLRTDRLVPGAIVDRREPDERMAGFPLARSESPDGVWAYTLYQKPGGRLFVHALDTQHRAAHCIDLPRLAPVSQSMLGMSLDDGRLAIVADGQVLAAVDRTTFRVTRSPEPAAGSAPTHTARPAATPRSTGAPLAVVVPVVLLVTLGVALAVRRRRPAAGQSGGAATGAPSGP